MVTRDARSLPMFTKRPYAVPGVDITLNRAIVLRAELDRLRSLESYPIEWAKWLGGKDRH